MSTVAQQSERALLLPEPEGKDAEPESISRSLPISFYWEVLKRYRAWIATFVLIATTAVVLSMLALPKEYESTVLLRVDPSSSRVVGDTNHDSTTQVEAGMLVATEAQVATSPAVVVQTIKQLNLGAEPEFRKAALDPPVDAGEVVSGALLRAVTKQISVNQPISTLLLEIGFRSRSPQVSAQTANALADAFLEHEYVTRAKALADSTRYMASQVDTMRAQMEQDEAALVTYESTHDLVDPDSKENIFEARLQQINTDLTKAQSDRMLLQTYYNLTQSGTSDALLATPMGASLKAAEQKLYADEGSLNHLATIYGPHHPVYQQQQAVVASDRSLLQERESHVANQVRLQFVGAVRREDLLRQALGKQKTEMDAFNMRAIQYRALSAKAKSSANLYNDLMQRIQDATVAAGLHSEDLRVISPARPSNRPVSPRPILDGMLALFLSALLGCGAAIALGLTDRTIGTAVQAEALLRRPVLGMLPQVEKRAQAALQHVTVASGGNTLERQDSRSRPYREAMLSLQSALQLGLPPRDTVIAVTSSVPGEGKSTTSSHLAAAFAEMGLRTALVDTDLRKPNVHRLFGLSNQRGLSTVLDGHQSIEQVAAEISPNLTVVPAGPVSQRSVELLRRGLGEVIEQLKNDHQFVFLDCPPLLGFADASLAANFADSTLLVVLAEGTDQRLIHASLRALRAGRTNLQGVILNCISARQGSEYGYSYSQYYTDASESTEDE